jgi:hypothetical protein
MIVEEVVKDDGKEELKISTLDDKGKIITNEIIEADKKGTHYKTVVTNDYVDYEGVRKVTLELRNNRNQTLMK